MAGGGLRDRLAVGQGLFFVATGVWPLVHLRSFEAVTGPKPEAWLVKTVGLLIAVTGATVARAGRRGAVTPEVAFLAAGSAAALAAVDVWYAGVRRRIAPVYLADAVVEVALAAAWIVTSPAARRRRRSGEARAPRHVDARPGSRADARQEVSP